MEKMQEMQVLHCLQHFLFRSIPHLRWLIHWLRVNGICMGRILNLVWIILISQLNMMLPLVGY